MEPTTRPQQTSLPPAYSANNTSFPYLDSSNGDMYLTLPYYTILPAFDAPPNYSRRLRRLIESRRKPTYLSLVIPVEKQKGIEQIFNDESSSTASSSTTGSFDPDEEKHVELLGDVQYEDIEEYNSNTYKPSRRSRSKKSQKYQRRLSIRDDAEISWASFAAMASVVLMVLCSCGIFMAWSTGLFKGAHGMGMMQAQMHGMDGMSASKGFSIGGATVDMTEPKAPAAAYVATVAVTGSQEAEMVEKEANTILTRREQIQKRAERRRRATRV